ncbi:MAG TPA: PEGA domain-containing protein, partial [Vicinamibacterales bacterium]
MSWNTQRHCIAVASLIAVISVPTIAHAQRGHGGSVRAVVARPIVVAPYASPYYDPFFWGIYGWGYPGWYGPGWWGPPAYTNSLIETSSARIQVTPRETEVYVDGYLAGVADDFDGVTQRLRVEPGEHVIELYLDGHKSITQAIRFAPGQSYRIRHEMQPLAAGDAAPVRPAPKPGSSAQRPAFDAFGNSIRSVPSTPGTPVSGSSITIRVQ